MLSALSSMSHCTIIISLPHEMPATRAEYRDLWYAAVAIVEMCVSQRRAGIATDLGEPAGAIFKPQKWQPDCGSLTDIQGDNLSLQISVI